MTIILDAPPDSNGREELGHAPVLEMPLADIRPSPENDKLYRPVDPNDPDILSLAASIDEHGVIEPIVVTLDGCILSGHRRYEAAKLAGLTDVPCRIEPIRRDDDTDAFIVLLREFNRQREKSLAEKLREEIVTADPDEAYESLIEHRRKTSEVVTAPFDIVGQTRRCRISKAKEPFLAGVLAAIKERRDYWPLSDRAIHYALLNDPPLTHASKKDSTYANSKNCYKALVDLLTRARLEGRIPFEAIGDETRPVVTWGVHREPRSFIRRALDGFLRDYWRDLMQSQPNHIEIIGEKNTVAPILKPVAGEYCIPLTTGRGYCSLPPRHAMAERYRRSGKAKLVLLIVSDFDPDGEEIAHSFARSMRDDFGIEDIHPVKVALTDAQVGEYDLPPNTQAKKTSANYKKFVAKHGEDVFELEAVAPDTLQGILRAAIDNVIDTDAFNAELDAEKRDATFLAGVRCTVHDGLGEVAWDEEGGE